MKMCNVNVVRRSVTASNSLCQIVIVVLVSEHTARDNDFNLLVMENWKYFLWNIMGHGQGKVIQLYLIF